MSESTPVRARTSGTDLSGHPMAAGDTGRAGVPRRRLLVQDGPGASPDGSGSVRQ